MVNSNAKNSVCNIIIFIYLSIYRVDVASEQLISYWSENVAFSLFSLLRYVSFNSQYLNTLY